MPNKMGVTTMVAGMFLTGCANSLLSKYQDMECVENCGQHADGPRLNFEQPVWQTLNMFIGEFMCGIPLLWAYYKNRNATKTRPEGYSRVATDEVENEEEEHPLGHHHDQGQLLSGWRMCLLWFPAFFDICGTTLMNAGLILTPVSIFQMSRGALVLWVGILSVIFLRRHLWLYQWASLIIVTSGVCLVGLSGSLAKKALNDPVELLITATARPVDDPARVAIGVMLILFAQIFTACQYVVEEKIMSRYKVEPLKAVTLEGFFGLTTTLVAMPFLHLFLRHRSPYFDIPSGWHQIVSTPTVFWSCFAIMFSIGSFNFFGLSVTHCVSATTRSTVDTCRTLGIWIVSLGLGWEALVWPESILQIVGFALLVYGTFVFNGLVKPLIFPPPSSVHLPHEPELEETGEVPAAGAQGRSGYDVIPDEERH
ncbi:integral membrane protein [Cryptococcus neoformans C23]|uniref:Integral membrane protein n=3 Tax=Cryptococcus neoformans TaxID=5207 RepID=A0A854Q262_CRYNE|nr:integral membrane protein [Cryptococcus neoformans var. grubii H99]AUB28872.1 integral membrane protein [Cryptococcus neoformans var. grubii]OWZ27017.1 integral membrane protein [Cryptococcus neoformans var. grubii AD2-60a]OWZ27848.1 integral membrane protein [Cryptococcus neoformans var. grubii AD1-83a]OWZ38878.1 integral membrane protein [Cryptococcus neoformans var. grubii C23]OWZ50351.1 integral membrane protein [Cryptococcus neoformans var. grubii 125.91]OXC81275.1 integral membrane p|eukprot:XP_012053505.1 integral membrane protein [Cryptococcus neoformans var. grubii H99]